MSEARLAAGVAVAAALSLACAPELPVSTAWLALHDVPARVQTVALSAFRVDSGELVTSATVAAADTELIALGLPAEVPLELRAVARTSTLAATGRASPAFFAREVRVVPLARDPVELTLVLRPAGILELEVDPGALEGDAPPLVLRAARSGVLDVPVPASGRFRGVLVAGSYRLEADAPPDGAQLRGAEGIWVEPEGVSRARPSWAAAPVAGAPVELRLELFDAEGRRLPSGALVRGATTAVTLEGRVEAVDADGAPVLDPAARVRLSVAADAAPRFLSGLPARFSVALSGPSRRVAIEAQLDGLAARSDLDLLAPGVAPGPPAGVRVALLAPEALRGSGARLDVWVTDARGLPARQAVGSIDLSMSDPWLRTLDGATRVLDPAAAGRARFTVLRASAPVGGGVRAIARFTPVAGSTLTSTLTLPPPGAGR